MQSIKTQNFFRLNLFSVFQYDKKRRNNNREFHSRAANKEYIQINIIVWVGLKTGRIIHFIYRPNWILGGGEN